jgi:hypothetical protein
MTDPAVSTPSPDPAAALEAEAAQAIAACGGDPRAAVRVLLVANAYLERENERLRQAVSAGFSRRKIRPRGKPKEPDKQFDL